MASLGLARLGSAQLGVAHIGGARRVCDETAAIPWKMCTLCGQSSWRMKERKRAGWGRRGKPRDGAANEQRYVAALARHCRWILLDPSILDDKAQGTGDGACVGSTHMIVGPAVSSR